MSAHQDRDDETDTTLLALSALAVVVSHTFTDTLKAAEAKLESEETLQTKMAECMLDFRFRRLLAAIETDQRDYESIDDLSGRLFDDMPKLLDLYIPVFNRLGYKVCLVRSSTSTRTEHGWVRQFTTWPFNTLRFEKPVFFGPLTEEEACWGTRLVGEARWQTPTVFWPTSHYVHNCFRDAASAAADYDEGLARVETAREQLLMQIRAREAAADEDSSPHSGASWE